MKKESESGYDSYQLTMDEYVAACNRLGLIFDEYSEGPVSARTQKKYDRWISSQIEESGEDSIVTILPKIYDRGWLPIKHAAITLIKNNVKTKNDLLMLTSTELSNLKGVGKFTEKLAVSMQEVAIAEFHLKWSSPR